VFLCDMQRVCSLTLLSILAISEGMCGSIQKSGFEVSLFFITNGGCDTTGAFQTTALDFSASNSYCVFYNRTGGGEGSSFSYGTESGEQQGNQDGQQQGQGQQDDGHHDSDMGEHMGNEQHHNKTINYAKSIISKQTGWTWNSVRVTGTVSSGSLSIDMSFFSGDSCTGKAMNDETNNGVVNKESADVQNVDCFTCDTSPDGSTKYYLTCVSQAVEDDGESYNPTGSVTQGSSHSSGSDPKSSSSPSLLGIGLIALVAVVGVALFTYKKVQNNRLRKATLLNAARNRPTWQLSVRPSRTTYNTQQDVLDVL